MILFVFIQLVKSIIQVTEGLTIFQIDSIAHRMQEKGTKHEDQIILPRKTYVILQFHFYKKIHNCRICIKEAWCFWLQTSLKHETHR